MDLTERLLVSMLAQFDDLHERILDMDALADEMINIDYHLDELEIIRGRLEAIRKVNT